MLLIFSIVTVILVFNFFTGIVYYGYLYWKEEPDFKRESEFWYLIFFPMKGVGNWRYNQEVRKHGKAEFPKEWYTYKYMIPINKAFILSLVIGTYLLLFFFPFDDFFSGSDLSNSHDNPAAAGAEILLDFGSAILGIFSLLAYLGVSFVVVTLLGVFMVLIPKSTLNRIEKMHYMEMAKKNEKDKE